MPSRTYIFKHALTREAAYHSLLASPRQEIHRRIAQVLEECFQETLETQPEQLAHHYTEAGCYQQAIGYWQRAGQRAAHHSAHVEAIRHLTQGLALLDSLPDAPGSAEQELALRMALGRSLMATEGYASPEVGRTYARARDLCQRAREPSQLSLVWRGLWGFYVIQGAYQTAYELGEQLLTLAQRARDPILLVGAHHALGNALYFQGAFAPALTHLEQSLALYDPEQHHLYTAVYGDDPGGICLAYAAFALWHLGYPERALQRSRKALALAQERFHPYDRAMALSLAAWLHQYRREVRTVQEWAEAAVTFATQQGFAFWAPWGTIFRGWALAMQGQAAKGIAQIRQGISAYRSTGAETGKPHQLALLAEAYGRAGRIEEGLEAVVEALTLVDAIGERRTEAELHRLRGELLWQGAESRRRRRGGDRLDTAVVAEAESCFHQALAVARRQHAKALELRAAMSLGRLWQRQGKRAEAQTLLADVYGWFTEGFDTADLQAAKALLEELEG